MALKKISDKVLAESIRKHSGLLTYVAKALGYTYMNVYKRVQNSEMLQQVVQEVTERTIDIAEGNVTKVMEGKPIAGEKITTSVKLDTSWKYLRTKGKNRGYKEEADLNVKQTMNPDLPNDYRKLYKLKYGHYPEDEKQD